MSQAIAPNSWVVLDYVLEGEEGEVLDESTGDGGEPIRYVHGYGMLVPGLEKRLMGLGSGTAHEFVVPAEEAYGTYDDELVMEIDRSEIPNSETVSEGDELVATDPDGEEAVLRVVEVKPEAVVVDGNHPLAGLALKYKITIREVRAATEAEIAAAATSFEEAEHAHGPDCDHDHDADGEKLVPLGKKPEGPPN